MVAKGAHNLALVILTYRNRFGPIEHGQECAKHSRPDEQITTIGEFRPDAAQHPMSVLGLIEPQAHC